PPFFGYISGTFVHVGALLLPNGAVTTQVANVEEAFSGASIANQGTNSVTQGCIGFVGTGQPPGAACSTPASSAGVIVNEMNQVTAIALGPNPAEQRAMGIMLQGETLIDWNTLNTCPVLGKPVIRGVGLAADAQILNASSTTKLPSPGSQPVVATDAGTPTD